MGQIEVLVEAGARRVLASAPDWPGWSRSGGSEADALAALAPYAPANPRRSLWPVAYAARRFVWHVLDHAWEMEDRRG